MWQLLLIYFFLIVWPLASYLGKPCPPAVLPTWMKNQSSQLRQNFSQESTKLVTAIICGEKKQLAPATLEAYRSLQLLHLFTPSGLHLTALLPILRPLWKLASKLHPLLGLLGEGLALLSILLFLKGPFYSLHRMALWRLIYLVSKNFWEKPVGPSFILAFAWDFWFGSYLLCPISFYYSFAFCSILVVAKGPLHRSYHFLTIYGLLGIMSANTVNLWAVLANALVIPVFSLLFPILLVFFGVGTWWSGLAFLLYPLELLHQSIMWMAHHLNFSLYFSYPLVLAMHLWRRPFSQIIKCTLLGTLLAIHSTPLDR